MAKLKTYVCLIVKAKKGDTTESIIYGKPLVRTWVGFSTFREALKFKPPNGGHVIAIIDYELDLEKF